MQAALIEKHQCWQGKRQPATSSLTAGGCRPPSHHAHPFPRRRLHPLTCVHICSTDSNISVDLSPGRAFVGLRHAACGTAQPSRHPRAEGRRGRAAQLFIDGVRPGHPRDLHAANTCLCSGCCSSIIVWLMQAAWCLRQASPGVCVCACQLPTEWRQGSRSLMGLCPKAFTAQQRNRPCFLGPSEHQNVKHKVLSYPEASCRKNLRISMRSGNPT